jgi:hypothetical protein
MLSSTSHLVARHRLQVLELGAACRPFSLVTASATGAICQRFPPRSTYQWPDFSAHRSAGPAGTLETSPPDQSVPKPYHNQNDCLPIQHLNVKACATRRAIRRHQRRVGPRPASNFRNPATSRTVFDLRRAYLCGADWVSTRQIRPHFRPAKFSKIRDRHHFPPCVSSNAAPMVGASGKWCQSLILPHSFQ